MSNIKVDQRHSSGAIAVAGSKLKDSHVGHAVDYTHTEGMPFSEILAVLDKVDSRLSARADRTQPEVRAARKAALQAQDAAESGDGPGLVKAMLSSPVLVEAIKAASSPELLALMATIPALLPLFG